MLTLPKAGLSVHCTTVDRDGLFLTYSAGGHSGKPQHGDACEVWTEEGDGALAGDFIWVYASVAGMSPTYHSPARSHIRPGLGEIRFDGSDDNYVSANFTGGATRPASDFLTASAGTMAFVIRPEDVSATSASPYNNHGLIGDTDGFMGLYLKDVGSNEPGIQSYNFSGGEQSTAAIRLQRLESYIVFWIHRDGVLYCVVVDKTGRVQIESVSSGNTDSLTLPLSMGHGYTSSGFYYQGDVSEMALWSVGLSGAALQQAISYLRAVWFPQPLTMLKASRRRSKVFAAGAAGFLLVKN